MLSWRDPIGPGSYGFCHESMALEVEAVALIT
jgi:hypothetical protein